MTHSDSTALAQDAMPSAIGSSEGDFAHCFAPPRYPAAAPPRIRPVRHSSISLALRGIDAGAAFVESECTPDAAYRAIKRAMDVFIALVVLAALAPIMAAIFFVLLVTTRGKPLFFQTRLGYLGKPFRMAKFRTMVVHAEKVQTAVANEQEGPVFKNRRDPRVTRIGRLLRSTSLDETPQLFNVLFGQMSLVGPRPPIAKEVAQYDPWQRRRLSVKPGLT